jgi:hypothetical protein
MNNALGGAHLQRPLGNPTAPQGAVQPTLGTNDLEHTVQICNAASLTCISNVMKAGMLYRWVWRIFRFVFLHKNCDAHQMENVPSKTRGMGKRVTKNELTLHTHDLRNRLRYLQILNH